MTVATTTQTFTSLPAEKQSTTGAAGANIYSNWLLAIYDWWVLGIVSTYAWRCPTASILLPFFRQHVSSNHLDIGVGTGYYLAKSDVPASTSVTLLDLNQNSLDAAKARFGRPSAETIMHDIFEPLDPSQKYGSISMFYLLHCLPGPVERKMAIFEHLKHNLTPDGVIYGANILGSKVKHNVFGKIILAGGNKEGFFDNRQDSAEAMERELKKHFKDVRCDVVGVIFMFSCSRPKLHG
ncbi:MAG: hypothetical protein Q9164_001648 [Protoblastenia rupestris]